MKIHALSTGSIRVKHSFLFPSPGPRRQLDCSCRVRSQTHCRSTAGRSSTRARCGSSTPVRRHRRETSRSRGRRSRTSTNFQPRWPPQVSASTTSPRLYNPRPRRPHQRARARTRAGPDQRDGTTVPEIADATSDAPCLASAAAARVRPRAVRARRWAIRSVSPKPGTQRRRTDRRRRDPGHTPGHISVICVDDAGRHVMLAGDATDTLEQLHARRADAVPRTPKSTSRRWKRSRPLRPAPDRLPALPRPRVSRSVESVDASRRRGPDRQTGHCCRRAACDVGFAGCSFRWKPMPQSRWSESTVRRRTR